jgi:hypothetical protein
MSPRRRVDKRRRRRTSLLLSPPSTRECQVRLPTLVVWNVWNVLKLPFPAVTWMRITYD